MIGKVPIRPEDYSFFNQVKNHVEYFERSYKVQPFRCTSIYRPGSKGAHGHTPVDAIDIASNNLVAMWILYLWLNANYKIYYGVFISYVYGNLHLHVTRWSKHIGRAWVEHPADSDGNYPLDLLDEEWVVKLKKIYGVKDDLNIRETERLWAKIKPLNNLDNLSNNSGCVVSFTILLLTSIGSVVYFIHRTIEALFL
jgi:hypothetical protein